MLIYRRGTTGIMFCYQTDGPITGGGGDFMVPYKKYKSLLNEDTNKNLSSLLTQVC